MKVYEVYTPFAVATVTADRYEKVFSNVSGEPVIRFYSNDWMVAEFFCARIYGWYERTTE